MQSTSYLKLTSAILFGLVAFSSSVMAEVTPIDCKSFRLDGMPNLSVKVSNFVGGPILLTYTNGKSVNRVALKDDEKLDLERRIKDAVATPQATANLCNSLLILEADAVLALLKKEAKNLGKQCQEMIQTVDVTKVAVVGQLEYQKKTLPGTERDHELSKEQLAESQPGPIEKFIADHADSIPLRKEILAFLAQSPEDRAEAEIASHNVATTKAHIQSTKASIAEGEKIKKKMNELRLKLLALERKIRYSWALAQNTCPNKDLSVSQAVDTNQKMIDLATVQLVLEAKKIHGDIEAAKTGVDASRSPATIKSNIE